MFPFHANTAFILIFLKGQFEIILVLLQGFVSVSGHGRSIFCCLMQYNYRNSLFFFFPQALIEHMIQRDPGSRHSIDQYLERERGLAFPENFYSFLWPFLKQFAVTPIMPHDDKIKQLVFFLKFISIFQCFIVLTIQLSMNRFICTVVSIVFVCTICDSFH